MFSSTLVAALFLLAGSVNAAPHPPAARTGKDNGPGPSGTLQTPNDGTTWHKTGEWGFGSGHIVYQGVNVDYNGAEYPDVNHVTTYSLDILLQSPDGQEEFYLANGIMVDQNQKLDQYFRVPMNYPESFGDYRLIIIETQKGRTSSSFAEAITFQSAAPLVHVTFSPSPYDP